MVTSTPAPSAPPGATAGDLPEAAHFGRNLVGGCWRFPAAPYEFEIRSPLDSTVITAVPLSSRFDVARAVEAAQAAAPAWAADPDRRYGLLAGLAAELRRLRDPLAALQSLETGLAAADSRIGADCAAALAASLAEGGTHAAGAGGVSGLVLSWGLPLADAASAVLPQLAAGRAVVVKPSLRAPMSMVALAYLATRLGFPPGVVNVVQGTGVDVGAALAGSRGLACLAVRAGGRTLAQGIRATTATGVPLRPLRAGGNAAVAGPDADLAHLAATLADATRVHSTGGPLGVPLLAVHADAAGPVVDAVLAALTRCTPAPLPTEPLRRATLDRVAVLRAAGGRVLCGGVLPDDVRHRMGWVLPPTVVALGALTGDAPGEPLGPLLTVATWRSPAELSAAMRHPRFADGIACLWGVPTTGADAPRLPQTVVLREEGPAAAVARGLLPASWTGDPR